MVYGAKFFRQLFAQYANGTAERTHPAKFIRPNPRKPEAVKTSEAGIRELLAYLLLANKSDVVEFAEYLHSVRLQLDAVSDRYPEKSVFGSKAKDDRARKYLSVFESAVLAAME